MEIFLQKHREAIQGVIKGFDRLIFKGHLTSWFPPGAPAQYLNKRGVLLKEAKKFFEAETARIVDHAKRSAEQASRPFIYLESAHTHASGQSKEAKAQEIAKSDNITEGLVCVFSVLETCNSFAVIGNHKTHRLQVLPRKRKCLHLYWYLIHPEFGWMHVRIQTWAPYGIQIYINGREWMCRQLSRQGVDFERSDNKIIWLSDFDAAEKLSEKFNHIDWPTALMPLVLMVNPLIDDLAKTGFGGYWLGIDQAEVTTDILFKSRAELEHIYKDMTTAAITAFGANDVMRFLGRKPNGNFKGEVIIDSKKRPEGVRVKFRMKRNSIKIYDHQNVLRLETTLNNPAEFKILRSSENEQGQSVSRWSPMRKGVSNFWRYSQVGHAANARLIDALANAPLQGSAIDELDRLSRSQSKDGRRVAGFSPVSKENIELFKALLSGEFALNGFRNADLQSKIFDTKPKDRIEAKRRIHRTSRLITKLRGHRLIHKVQNLRLYRLSAQGVRTMWAAVRLHDVDFPCAFNLASTFAQE